MTTAAPLVHHGHPARWAQPVADVPLPRPRTDGELSAGRGILYGSFACPWSYLASQRTSLIPDPAQRPAWRMVDLHSAPGSRLAAPGLRLDVPSADRAAAELEAVRALLVRGEHLPARAPAFVPHTGPAVIGYAEAVGAGVGADVRRLLFDAFWQQGLDIGLPDVLRRVLHAPLRGSASAVRPVQEHGYAVTLTGGPITTDAHHRAHAWHRHWRATCAAGLPALTTDATTTSGRAALVSLTERRDHRT